MEHSARVIRLSVFTASILASFAGIGFAENTNVAVAGFSFSPQHVTVLVGDTVTWQNTSGFHNASAIDGTFRCANGCVQTGGNGDPASSPWSATFQFGVPDLEAYQCEIHGPGFNMTGSVNVLRSVFADGFEGGTDDEWVPLVAAGDACTNPITITQGDGAVAGNLQGALNDFDLTTDASCFPGVAAHGRDRVYSVFVGANQTLIVTITPNEPTSPDFDPAVYVQEDTVCGTAPAVCLDAVDTPGPGNFETLTVDPSGAQRVLHIYVDTLAPASQGSDFTIAVAII